MLFRSYPDAGRFWKMIQDHKVTVFYTAPTAIRSLIKAGGDLPKKYNLNSLRILGTVGEPINPEAWIWYHETVGGGRCPIVDTWWQTETGGHMITPLPGATATKPGSATFPLPGVIADIVDVARGALGPAFGRPAKSLQKPKRGSIEGSVSAYYLRFLVRDVPGVMAEISRHLADQQVSIESMLQRGRDPGEPVAIVMITHEAPRASVERALKAIAASDKVFEAPCMIPMEAA